MPPQRLAPPAPRARLSLIGPDSPQTRARMPEDGQPGLGPVTSLPTRSGDDDGEEHRERLDQEGSPVPLVVQRRIVPAGPPVSVVCTAGRSSIPALGCRRLPAAPRTSPRR
jgi:hypothetical protein